MKRKHVKLSVVGFFDVLGFSARVEEAKTFKAFRSIESDLLEIQKEFGTITRDKWDKIDDEITERKTLVFSDSIVYSVPLSSDLTELQGTYDSLMMELDRIALAQGSLVLRGIFLRGGLEIGPWFHKRDTTISPALITAVRLEKQVCVPIIALSKSVYDHFATHKDRSYYADGFDGLDIFVKRKMCNGRFFYILDYIGICLAEMEDRSEARLWLSEHKSALETAMKPIKDRSILSKYEWLVKYHNSHVRNFGRAFSDLKI